MAISLLYGCFQVELTVRNLDSARRFMTEVLGAAPMEQELAREIEALFPNGGYRVDHFDCGQATFQVNEPSARLRGSVHQANLERIGPCVSNLNYYVDDIVHARTLLSELGAEIRTEGPSATVPSLADYGPDNTRPGGADRPFVFMATRHLIGLDLEIMEPNFLRFVDQAVQVPCYLGPRRGSTDLRLQRLRIAVEDLTRAYDHVVRIFTPGSRSIPHADRAGARAQAFRICLGGIEVEYCAPTAPGPLAEYLERYGPGVVTIEFVARDVAGVLERAQEDGSAAVAEETDLLGVDRSGGRWQIASRELIGFDVVLGEIGFERAAFGYSSERV